MRGLGGLWVRQPLSQRATIRDARAPNPRVASLPSFAHVLPKSARWRRRAPRRARSGAIVDEADPRACARGVVARPRAVVASHASGRQASSPARPRRAPACAGRSRRSRGARSPLQVVDDRDDRLARPPPAEHRHRAGAAPPPRALLPRRPARARALLLSLLLLLRTLPLRRELTHDRSPPQSTGGSLARTPAPDCDAPRGSPGGVLGQRPGVLAAARQPSERLDRSRRARPQQRGATPNLRPARLRQMPAR